MALRSECKDNQVCPKTRAACENMYAAQHEARKRRSNNSGRKSSRPGSHSKSQGARAAQYAGRPIIDQAIRQSVSDYKQIHDQLKRSPNPRVKAKKRSKGAIVGRTAASVARVEASTPVVTRQVSKLAHEKANAKSPVQKLMRQGRFEAGDTDSPRTKRMELATMRMKTEQLDQELRQTRALHRLAIDDIKRSLASERSQSSQLRDEIHQLQSEMVVQQKELHIHKRRQQVAMYEAKPTATPIADISMGGQSFKDAFLELRREQRRDSPAIDFDVDDSDLDASDFFASPTHRDRNAAAVPHAVPPPSTQTPLKKADRNAALETSYAKAVEEVAALKGKIEQLEEQQKHEHPSFDLSPIPAERVLPNRRTEQELQELAAERTQLVSQLREAEALTKASEERFEAEKAQSAVAVQKLERTINELEARLSASVDSAKCVALEDAAAAEANRLREEINELKVVAGGASTNVGESHADQQELQDLRAAKDAADAQLAESRNAVSRIESEMKKQVEEVEASKAAELEKLQQDAGVVFSKMKEFYTTENAAFQKQRAALESKLEDARIEISSAQEAKEEIPAQQQQQLLEEAQAASTHAQQLQSQLEEAQVRFEQESNQSRNHKLLLETQLNSVREELLAQQRNADVAAKAAADAAADEIRSARQQLESKYEQSVAALEEEAWRPVAVVPAEHPGTKDLTQRLQHLESQLEDEAAANNNIRRELIEAETARQVAVANEMSQASAHAHTRAHESQLSEELSRAVAQVQELQIVHEQRVKELEAHNLSEFRVAAQASLDAETTAQRKLAEVEAATKRRETTLVTELAAQTAKLEVTTTSLQQAQAALEGGEARWAASTANNKDELAELHVQLQAVQQAKSDEMHAFATAHAACRHDVVVAQDHLRLASSIVEKLAAEVKSLRIKSNNEHAATDERRIVPTARATAASLFSSSEDSSSDWQFGAVGSERETKKEEVSHQNAMTTTGNSQVQEELAMARAELEKVREESRQAAVELKLRVEQTEATILQQSETMDQLVEDNAKLSTDQAQIEKERDSLSEANTQLKLEVDKMDGEVVRLRTLSHAVFQEFVSVVQKVDEAWTHVNTGDGEPNLSVEDDTESSLAQSHDLPSRDVAMASLNGDVDNIHATQLTVASTYTLYLLQRLQEKLAAALDDLKGLSNDHEAQDNTSEWESRVQKLRSEVVKYEQECEQLARRVESDTEAKLNLDASIQSAQSELQELQKSVDAARAATLEAHEEEVRERKRADIAERVAAALKEQITPVKDELERLEAEATSARVQHAEAAFLANSFVQSFAEDTAAAAAAADEAAERVREEKRAADELRTSVAALRVEQNELMTQLEKLKADESSAHSSDEQDKLTVLAELSSHLEALSAAFDRTSSMVALPNVEDSDRFVPQPMANVLIKVESLLPENDQGLDDESLEADNGHEDNAMGLVKNVDPPGALTVIQLRERIHSLQRRLAQLSSILPDSYLGQVTQAYESIVQTKNEDDTDSNKDQKVADWIEETGAEPWSAVSPKTSESKTHRNGSEQRLIKISLGVAPAAAPAADYC